MKANELMLGDWVIIPMSATPIKIASVNGEGITIYNEEDYTEYPYYISDIKPIPLTSEILEKNGYSYNETRDAWELIPNDGFGICKDEDDNCFYFCLGIFDAFNSYSDITYHYITKVEYVHELQHALKLCGIEKEIIL